jgi:glycerol-3-phosphate dehydrogenase subunit C
VKIAEMNARARAEIVSQGKVPIHLRLRNNLIARAETLGKIAHPVAQLANALLSNRVVRVATEATLQIHRDAPLPKFSAEKFSSWFNNRQVSTEDRETVVYFHGCSTEYYEPRVGKAAVRVLEALGYQVIVPPQNCCGLPLLSNGEFSAARNYHENNVSSLLEYAQNGVPIVGTSTSCTLTLKEEAPELLDRKDTNSQTVANSTYDFNEFLLNAVSENKFPKDLTPIPLTLAYHVPCQYRAHRIGKPGVELLSLIPELTTIDTHASCCGIAGTYGYKKEKYDIAMQVGSDLFTLIRKLGAPLAICDSETCRWQITHATGVPTIHPAELIAASMGLEIEDPLAQVLEELSAL